LCKKCSKNAGKIVVENIPENSMIEGDMEELKNDTEGQDSDQTISENSGILGEFEKAQKERDEYLDGWRRAKADLSNWKKDEDYRLSQLTKFSNESFIKELLSVLDSFELHIAELEKSGTVDQGMLMIKGQFEGILKKRGLEVIAVTKGDEFDPQKHEAVFSVDEEGISGTVAGEVEKGYMLQGKVIRASRVKVIK
jgi:molecular chaperone GrpE